MKTCLVVPCHIRNQRDENRLRRLVDSALKQILPFHSIIIADDASPYTFDCGCKGVDCLRVGLNSGPANARNKGIERALELESDFILFSDHDCVLSDDWAYRLTQFMKTYCFEAAGGLTLSYGATLIDKFHNTNGTLNGRLLLPGRKHMLYTPTCNFALSCLVAESFRFDTRYRKAAGEDVDYCLKIRKKYPIGFCQEAIVWHDFGYSSTLAGMLRMISMFKKYKEANSLLYESYPEYFANSWYESEAINAQSY